MNQHPKGINWVSHLVIGLALVAAAAEGNGLPVPAAQAAEERAFELRIVAGAPGARHGHEPALLYLEVHPE